jgi:hypothetical protein
MASDIDFVNYVIDQTSEAGVITSKKMSGEYIVYVNGKPIILICDNMDNKTSVSVAGFEKIIRCDLRLSFPFVFLFRFQA